KRRGAFRHPAQDRHPAGHLLDGREEEINLLRVLQRAVFAHRTEHDEPVDPRLDHPFDVAERGRNVQRLVRSELCGCRREHASPVDAHSSIASELPRGGTPLESGILTSRTMTTILISHAMSTCLNAISRL